MSIVEVNDLVKQYEDGTEAVKGISFDVEEREVFGILGPNGAGKTSTLEMLETLIPVTGGTAQIDGYNIAKEPDKIKQVIGVQPQSSGFQDKTKLGEILELFAAAYGRKVDVMASLKAVELQEKKDTYIENLSGGQRQRLSIAAALVHQPKIFFMDEPTTGLDPHARRNLWNLVQTIRDNGVTVVLTTHYMEEAEALCDRVAIMDKGKIIAIDTPRALIKSLLERGFKKDQIVEQANLEDVFIDLTGKKLNR